MKLSHSSNAALHSSSPHLLDKGTDGGLIMYNPHVKLTTLLRDFLEKTSTNTIMPLFRFPTVILNVADITPCAVMQM